MRYLASFKAMQATVVLTLLWQGLLSQNSDYRLTNLPASISVRQGLQVHIPCQFTFPRQTRPKELYGYWFKKEFLSLPTLSQPDRLVATNDQKAAIDRSAANRFQLMGDPDRGNCSFSINNIQGEDEGFYYFRIEQGSLKYSYVNHSNGIHTTPFVFVLEPPQVVKILANVTSHRHAAWCSQEANGTLEVAVAREGKSVSLQCIAKSKPIPTMSWMKENKTLGGSKQSKEHHLLLSKVRPKDAGEYHCRAETPYGSAKKSLQLCVQYSPRLSSPQGSPPCRQLDNDLLCSCSLSSWPPPQMQWQVDGETVNRSIPGESLWVSFQAQGDKLTSTLTWTGYQNGDHSIVCFATNPFGTHTLQFVLPSSITRAHPHILIFAIGGPLITAGLFLLGTCLIGLWKRRQVSFRSQGQQTADDANEVYVNINLSEGNAPVYVLQDSASRYSGIYFNFEPPDNIA